MGVTGLWTVLQPCARPIKIETLNKKRLAVDASIWIYQFLKAVRDKEGNALRNSHIVGFFRRICKLLFFGIKPVFVFDGGAPALKRQTISNRKSRREGRREDAVRTAGKLLAIQMQRAAEEEEKKRKTASRHAGEERQEDIPEDMVYADEVLQTQQERQQNRKFRKKDQYHLPDMGMSMSEMGGQNDPRIMSLEELEEYARQFDSGEDINVYDFSKIDFDSPFFVSLPASDRYNILNAARLRSRLRMGYSKDQLDTMFPDRMAFSKFQIDRVRERNELTQRLMNLNGMNDDAVFGANSANRVASEKSREYVLVKNDGVEGGWALGVVTNKDEGKVDKPIDVDRLSRPQAEDEDWEDEDEFEDIPIEGLNRLPKSKPRMAVQTQESRDFVSKELAKRRQNFYNSRREGISMGSKSSKKAIVPEESDSLFLAEDIEYTEQNSVMDDETDPVILSEQPGDDEEDDQLQQAIALSFANDAPERTQESEEEDAYREVFEQERAADSIPFTRGSGLTIARQANARSGKIAQKAGPFDNSDSENDDVHLTPALGDSNQSEPSMYHASKPRIANPMIGSRPDPKSSNAPGFNGPLPFEKLNLGSSLLGKKKMQKIEHANAGGFEKSSSSEKKTSNEPLPPWFAGERNLREELIEQRAAERRDWAEARAEQAEVKSRAQGASRLAKQDYHEVIDVDAESSQDEYKQVIVIGSNDEDEDNDIDMQNLDVEEPKISKAEPTDETRANLVPSVKAQISSTEQDSNLVLNDTPGRETEDEPIDWSESEPEAELQRANRTKVSQVPVQATTSPSTEFADALTAPVHSPSPEFEDVPINSTLPARTLRESPPFALQGAEDLVEPLVPYSGPTIENDEIDVPANASDSDQYSDPEDAELFASLAAEAEEHARFAQELNANKSPLPVDFEQELKQLRAQQKKDRRDADEVTQTMISECQHLLTLFGLPYITAPMEAEAQCAELVHLGLVDGIVTDDSDTFLFGGTRVYKNMFNAAKFVECYLANDFETEFNLTRQHLIAIAQLLGSDYTTGIPGIGPVTALELLSEFGTLQEFKAWWTSVQEGKISKETDKPSAFRRRFRRLQTTKLFLPTNFPDPRVAEAYLEPDVDPDPHPFVWGVPDLDALRTFLSSQIGWSRERTDEVLVPVIKDMNRREKEGTQSNITRFFEGGVGAGAFAPRVRDDGSRGGGLRNGKKRGKSAAGKRLGAALDKLAEKDNGKDSTNERGVVNANEEVIDELHGNSIRLEGARKRKKQLTADEEVPDSASDHLNFTDIEDDDPYSEPTKRARKATRREGAKTMRPKRRMHGSD